MLKGFLNRNWLGFLIIGGATLIFFAPVIARIDSYSPGGDAMFNAWEMRRNQNCLLGNNCSDYTDANIYFPNVDTMLYSEAQLSAGLITLPLYWLNDSPIFAYNILTTISFFLSGWFMYLLAKYLSKDSKAVSILAGLLFAFAPFKIAGISHLQNLSIFCLPLATLLILKYLGTSKRKYLIGLFLALLYVFYASWVQMVFVLMALGILVAGLWAVRSFSFKKLLPVALTIGLATLATWPLAKEYLRFSKENNASFGLSQQILYSSNVVDYLIPQEGTILGKIYYGLKPDATVNSMNPDSISYHGFIVYIVSIFVVLAALWLWWRTKKLDDNTRIVLILVVVALVGLLVSLGPFLKLKGTHLYPIGEELSVVIPLPWLIVNKVLPQLGFIRAIGRTSVLALFAFSCLLAFLPYYWQRLKTPFTGRTLGIIVGVLFLVELAPMYSIPMATQSFAYNLKIPAVYRYVHESDVDNIVILNADYDYPGAVIPFARAEQVLWAGYHNKNIFNGYSGYTPPDYVKDFEDYIDFDIQDVEELKSRGIRFVLVDKLLMTTKPWVRDRVASHVNQIDFEDDRYTLFRL